MIGREDNAEHAVAETNVGLAGCTTREQSQTRIGG